MKYFISIFLFLILSLRIGNAQTASEFTLAAFQNLYNGNLENFGNSLDTTSKGVLGFYLVKDTIFDKISNHYELEIIGEAFKDNTYNVQLLINNNKFNVKLEAEENKQYKLKIGEVQFRSLISKEPLICYLIGRELYDLGYNEDSFYWIFESAKQGYAPAQYMIFGGNTAKSYWWTNKPDDKLLTLLDRWDSQYHDSLAVLIDILPDDTPFELSSSQSYTLEFKKRILEIDKESFLSEYDYDAYMKRISKKAEAGDTRYMNRLGNEYSVFTKHYNGGENLNAYWYQKSAEHGNIDAMLQIASYYETEQILGIDYEQAFYWYNKVFEIDNEHSVIIKLIEYYYNGKGVKQDKEKALTLLKKAKELSKKEENWRITQGIGNLYYGDIEELTDKKRALFYYRKVGVRISTEELGRLVKLEKED